MTAKTVTILGATGSIGTQTLEVLALYPEQFQLGFITTHRNIDRLHSILQQFSPKGIVICDPEACAAFQRTTTYQGTILCGEEALVEVAADSANDIVVSALVGFAGVRPTLAALEQGINVALANKEVLVSAGELVTATARRSAAALIPIDSEHSAIAQCLMGERKESIEKIILTASGGPFRNYTLKQLHAVTLEEALRHPNWKMGPKITIDSATLMNKGLEMIEARWLFDLHPAQIEVLIHPQSIVHSLVQFVDGSIKAQLGLPDMRLPILYALSAPQRLPTPFPRTDLAAIHTLTFEPPDENRFPCLRLARQVLETGGTAPTILNAANEVAVQAFINRKIRFTDIPVIIAETLEKITPVGKPSLADIIAADSKARSLAERIVATLPTKV